LAYRLLVRVVVSAVVGALLLVAWIAAYRTGALNRIVDDTDLGAFILLVVVGLPVALVVSVLMAGPLLWLLRVRPVWPIVLTGPILLGLAQYFKFPQHLEGVADRWTAQVLLAGAAYGLAALITAPTMARKRD
jgi:hypothetical protein